MTEFKGTKGKWERITANWDLDQCVFVEDTEKEICTIKSEAHNQMYDALLISKSPEMLEMLKSVKDLLEAYPSEAEIHLKAVEIRDLIKEATEL